ncbi:conserved protein of unknown function [Methanoculleus bourgensis]|uniref:Uncharacterized protein n=1 Tax=Methanoculleus bourgensis TaxID=83986 RepID=A0A0X3BNW3_9EURY|nr:conserved protein of unknown function [Methanoculleus bourgensis]
MATLALRLYTTHCDIKYLTPRQTARDRTLHEGRAYAARLAFEGSHTFALRCTRTTFGVYLCA